VRVCIHEGDLAGTYVSHLREIVGTKSHKSVDLTKVLLYRLLILPNCCLHHVYFYSFVLYLSFFCSVTYTGDKKSAHTHIGIMSGESAVIYRPGDVLEVLKSSILWDVTSCELVEVYHSDFTASHRHIRKVETSHGDRCDNLKLLLLYLYKCIKLTRKTEFMFAFCLYN
jgi:hypothetical protein